MKVLSKFVTALAILPILAFASPVFAGSPGQLAGGDDFEAKNLTQGGGYGDVTSAACSDEVKYSMMLSNTQFGSLDNVTLKVNLPSAGGVATATATTDLGGTSGTSDTTTVNLSSGTIAYESGSTVLYDDSGNLIKSLPDGVTTSSGVDMGTLQGSTTVFLDFTAKVNCQPPTQTFTATATATANANANASCPNGSGSASASASATASATATSTISQADADQQAQDQANSKAVTEAKASASAKAKAEVVCTTPTVVTTTAKKPAAKVLPNTGPGDVAELFVGTSALGSIGHFFVSRRRR